MHRLAPGEGLTVRARTGWTGLGRSSGWATVLLPSTTATTTRPSSPPSNAAVELVELDVDTRDPDIDVDSDE